MLLRIAGVIKESVVDGPGLRYVIFTQGCPHSCAGCHNPQTHDFAKGYDVSITELLDSIKQVKLISGITLSGGEPFAQAKACAELARLVKETKKTMAVTRKQEPQEFDVVTYSGYYYADLLLMAEKNPAINELLEATDILIDGPYDETQNNPSLPFRGSDNQSMIYLCNRRIAQ